MENRPIFYTKKSVLSGGYVVTPNDLHTISQSMGVGGCRWVSVGVGGCRWVSVGVGGCRWVLVGVGGCRWVSVGVGGCRWDSSFGGNLGLFTQKRL